MDVSYSILRKRKECIRIDLSMKLALSLLTRVHHYIYIYLDREYICSSRSIEIVVCCMSSVAPWNIYNTPRFSYHE